MISLTPIRRPWLFAACLLLLAAAVPHAWAASHSISLVWTATGDDADAGRAYRYDLRYSTSSVTDTASWWSSATAARNLPSPSPSGSLESAVVAGLTPETTYFFVLRVYDEGGNASGFSNVASATTDSLSTGAGEAAPGEAGTLHAFPNPSRDAVQFVIHVDGADEQKVRIRLFDLSGRMVADIADGSFPSGDTVVSWPRVTSNGDRVAPGYYESIGWVGVSPVRERLILLP